MSIREAISGWFARRVSQSRQTTAEAARSETRLILYLLVGFAVAGGVAFYSFEPGVKLADSFYWALVTMTTVGYGDVTPKTDAGRIVAAVLMLAGVTILALISATIASFLVERRLKEGKGLSEVNTRDHLVVAGWASQGEVVLHNINIATHSKLKDVVLINELEEAQIDALAAKYNNVRIRYVHGDPTHDFILKRANVEHAAVAIVLAGRYGEDMTEDAVDSRTMKVVMGLRSFSSELRIFAELRSVDNEQHLLRAGADEIISPAEMGANVLANTPHSPGLPILLRELLAFRGNGFRTLEIPQRFVGQPVRELCGHFREQNATLVGLVSESKSLALEDLLQHQEGSFIDAFIQNQFAETEQGLDERSRFNVRINPADDEKANGGELAMVIMVQTVEEYTD